MFLTPHSLTPCEAVTRLEVDAVRVGDAFTIAYRVSGQIADVHWPARTARARAAELWRHTCFEAFVRASSEDAYTECNFSPSTQWAAYRFDAYRAGMRNAEMAAPAIETTQSAAHFLLLATLSLNDPRPWRLALTAVIEETSGRLSYWSLAHPRGKPDFHHADGFVFDLSREGQA